MSEGLLSDKELLVIFATAPTGLGHIRVTDALYHGLPESVTPILLGAQDRSVDSMYRFVSLHPYTRAVMEILQSKPWEKLFAIGAKWYIRSQTKLLYQQFITVLGERLTVPKTVLIVATHNMLAHQLGKIKKKLEIQSNAKIYLVVQVTDDSPQPFWYVPEADLILVPSLYTKQELYKYAKQSNLRHVPVEVIAYPVSPLLTESLTDTMFEERLSQVNPNAHSTNISIPISGAAVGTEFTTNIVKTLHKLDPRYKFHIVSKEAYYTKVFIEKMKHLPYVNIYTASHDRTTVNNYENIFLKNNNLALEITKPSEQAFKALCLPKQRGGVILLFSAPIGRQEYDNLHFLRARGMLPSKAEQAMLWEYARSDRVDVFPLFKNAAERWRGVCLPENPSDAAHYIDWSLKQQFFMHMMSYKRLSSDHELRSDGVAQFWNTAADLLRNKTSV